MNCWTDSTHHVTVHAMSFFFTVCDHSRHQTLNLSQLRGEKNHWYNFFYQSFEPCEHRYQVVTKLGRRKTCPAFYSCFTSIQFFFHCLWVPEPNGNNLKALMLVSGQPFWRSFVRNRWESEKFPLHSLISGNSNSIKQKASTKFLSQLGFKQMNLGVPKSGKNVKMTQFLILRAPEIFWSYQLQYVSSSCLCSVQNLDKTFVIIRLELLSFVRF